MHEDEADAQGLRLVYSRFDFAELGFDAEDLPRMLAALELAGFAGVNVTHPFKQAVIEYLDDLSPEAGRIGAVNTVAFRGGRRIGFNTDVTGFANACDESLDGASMNRVLLAGAGGAGAAVACALLDRGVTRLTIYDVDRGRTSALLGHLGTHYARERLTICDSPAEALASVDGFVNATPMGMAGHPGTAVPADALDARLWVADVVYFPLETALLAAARRAGCRVMDGSGMAVHQAAGAFGIFTGRPASAARMRATFDAFDR